MSKESRRDGMSAEKYQIERDKTEKLRLGVGVASIELGVDGRVGQISTRMNAAAAEMLEHRYIATRCTVGK